MSRERIVLVAGIMLSLFMASVESTVVATAMPTIVSDLGGLSVYSWVFSAYMLAATTTVPIYGKLSDIYGRRKLFAVSMALFLTGSVLSGQSQNMSQLIAFRVMQGLGAGGLQPLAFIMVGDMFTLEQRANMQGLFSGVWGVSSIFGPLLGGFLVDSLSWRWVFYVNVLPGFLALVIILLRWRDQPREAKAVPVVDYAGVALLAACVVTLLMGLFEFGTQDGWILLALALAFFGALLWIERRAADPILPLPLFKDRLFAAACAQGLLASWAMFGTTAFVPLFVQAVLGTDATRAGITLTPQLLGWVFGAIVGSRLILHVGYRSLALFGMVSLAGGALLLTTTSASSSQAIIMVYMAMMGVGMGLSIAPFLIAVQSTVARRQLGTATATVQFSRSIGGAIGVSVMGAVLSFRLAANLAAAGLDPATVQYTELIDPLAKATVAVTNELRLALAGAIHGVFVVAFLAAGLALLVTTFAPKGRIAQIVEQRGLDQNGRPAPSSVAAEAKQPVERA